MKERSVMWPRAVFPWVLGFCLVANINPCTLVAAQSPQNAPANKSVPQASSDSEEQNVIDSAFRSADGNPQALLANLEAFLTRFPQSSRRELVLRTICTYASQANSPDVVVEYGQKLLELTPGDPQLLLMLIQALSRRNDQASRVLAVDYTSRVIKIAEAQRDRAAATRDDNNAREQWAERIAASYAQRAGFYRDSSDLDKAMADYERSYATYPTARIAEQLGDICLQRGDSARAQDYYLTAFVLPDKDADFERRLEIRRKLGGLYVAQHHSEEGLGALLLARYDLLMQQFAGRLSSNQAHTQGSRDPFDLVLERIDGTPLPMAPYRGKVVVIDFWATWCGPCRMQGKLVDKVAEQYRADHDAAFLSLSTDQDRSGVPAFLKQQGWTLPAAYAQGLDHLLGVSEIPTLVIFDRQGRIVFRQEGVNPESFVPELNKHLRDALQVAGDAKR